VAVNINCVREQRHNRTFIRGYGHSISSVEKQVYAHHK